MVESFGWRQWTALLFLAAFLAFSAGGCARIEAASALRDGEYDKAANLYEDILRESPGSGGARIGLGRTLLYKGEYERAAAQFGEARDVGAGWEATYWLGISQMLAGDVSRGFELLESMNIPYAFEMQDDITWHMRRMWSREWKSRDDFLDEANRLLFEADQRRRERERKRNR